MKNQVRREQIALAAALMLSLPAHLCADITLSTGPASVSAAPRMSFVTRTTSQSTTRSVGAFALALTYNPAVVKILSVTPATGSPFVDNMSVDSASFTSGRTRVVAFQTQTTLPVEGEQLICAVRWLPIGTNGTAATIAANIETLIDAEWRPLSVTALPTLLTVTDTDSDGDGMADVWEEAHGLNAHNPADALLDTDGDGLSNLHEFKADTDPRNSASTFQIATTEAKGSEFIIRFTTVLGRVYRVEATDNLSAETWTVLIKDNIVGTGDVVEVNDSNMLGVQRRFYRAVTQ